MALRSSDSVLLTLILVVLGCRTERDRPLSADTHASDAEAESLLPARTRPADVIRGVSNLPEGVAPDRIVVKYKPSLEACAHCIERAGQAFREHTSDRSASIDELHATLGVRSIRAVFRSEADEDDLRASLGAGVLRTTEVEELAADRRRAAAERNPGRASRAPSASGEARGRGLARSYVVELGGDVDPIAAARAYAADPHVEWAQPSYAGVIQSVPNDPLYASSGSWGQGDRDQWNLVQLGMESAWGVSKGAGIVIAVVDTGLDYLHPDIAANVSEIPGWDFHDGDADPMDEHGHGTHVAGIAAAVGDNGIGVVGVAPLAKVLPVRALGPNGEGEMVALAQAIEYAAASGADVINNSWGCASPCPYNPIVEEAVAAAHADGAVVVFAAGNSGSAVEAFSPQNMTSPKPIVVSAQFLPVGGFQLPPWPNRGIPVDLTAPGDRWGVLSLKASAWSSMEWPIVDDQYLVLKGTSMAAPHAAGAAALMLAAHPGMSNDDVRRAMAATAKPSTWFLEYAFGDKDIGVVDPPGMLAVTAPLATDVASPTVGQEILGGGGPLTIVGTAAGLGFASYQLEATPVFRFPQGGVASEGWQPFGPAVSTPVVAGPLGAWPLPAPRLHRLRVTATAADGTKYRHRTEVGVMVPETVPAVSLDPGFGNQSLPALSGGRVAWMDDRSGVLGRVWVRDLASGVEQQVASDHEWWWVDVSGATAVVGSPEAVGVVDLEHPELGVEIVGAGSYSAPRISGERIVWWSDAGIELHDLATGAGSTLALPAGHQPAEPDISGDRVVYTHGQDVWLHTLSTGATEQITDDADSQQFARIAGDWIVWRHRFGLVQRAVAVHDLVSGSTQIVTPAGTEGLFPSVSEDGLVAWHDVAAVGGAVDDIHAFDARSQRRLRVTTHPEGASATAVDGRRVVWDDEREKNHDLRTAELDRCAFCPGEACSADASPGCPCTGGRIASGDRCLDVDECAIAGGGCGAGATCRNEAGAFPSCTCNAGYAKDAAGACVDVDECATTTHGCGEGTTCTNTTGARVCCSGATCTDVCAFANGGCSPDAICAPVPGSTTARTCACKPGTYGDGTWCAPIGACAVGSACASNATCTDTSQGAHCECADGFDGGGAACGSISSLVPLFSSADQVGPGDGPAVPDGAADDGVFSLTVTGAVKNLRLVLTDADGNAFGGVVWDTYAGSTPIPAAMQAGYSVGAQTWVLGVREGGVPRNGPDGSLVPLADGVHELELFAAWGVWFQGEHVRVDAELADGTIVVGPSRFYGPLEPSIARPTTTLEPVDRAGPGDAGVQPDGVANDLRLDVTITGAVKNLRVVLASEQGMPFGGVVWDTYTGPGVIPQAMQAGYATGAQTWAAAVYEGTTLRSAPNGSLPLLPAGKHELSLFLAEGLTYAGFCVRVDAELADGTILVGPILWLGAPPTVTTQISPASLGVDLVGPGDANVSADGAPDAVIGLWVDAPISNLALLGVDAEGNPNGFVFDTITGDTQVPDGLSGGFPTGASTWVLGVGQAGALLNEPDGSMPILSSGWGLELYATSDWWLFGWGLSWRVAVQLADGTVVHSDTFVY